MNKWHLKHISLLLLLILVSCDLYANANANKVDCSKAVDSKKYMLKGQFDSKTPADKLYNFQKIRADIKTELVEATKIDESKLNCMYDLYKEGIKESSRYWAERGQKEGCFVGGKVPKVRPNECAESTWKEFKKSRQYLQNLQEEFKKDLRPLASAADSSKPMTAAPMLNCKTQATPPKALEDLLKTSEDARLNLCCGTESEKSGVVRSIYSDINFNQCLSKVKETNDDILSAKGLAVCSANIVSEAVKTIWDSIKSLFSLPSEIMGIMSTVKELVTSEDAREKFVANIKSSVKQFLNTRGDAFSQCLNKYEQSMYICEVTGNVVGGLVDIGAIAKVIKALKTGKVGAEISGLLSKTPKGQAVLSSLKRADDFASSAAGKVKSNAKSAADNVVQKLAKDARALAFAAQMLKRDISFDFELTKELKNKARYAEVVKDSAKPNPEIPTARPASQPAPPKVDPKRDEVIAVVTNRNGDKFEVLDAPSTPNTPANKPTFSTVTTNAVEVPANNIPRISGGEPPRLSPPVTAPARVADVDIDLGKMEMDTPNRSIVRSNDPIVDATPSRPVRKIERDSPDYEFEVGERVAVPRSNGTFTEGRVSRDFVDDNGVRKIEMLFNTPEGVKVKALSKDRLQEELGEFYAGKPSLLSQKKTAVPETRAPASAEIARIEAPRIETPRIDAPRIEAPKVDAPRVELLRLEAPKQDLPKPKTVIDQDKKLDGPILTNEVAQTVDPTPPVRASPPTNEPPVRLQLTNQTKAAPNPTPNPTPARSAASAQNQAVNRVRYLNEQSGDYSRYMTQTQRQHQAGLLRIVDDNRIAAIDFKVKGTEAHSKRIFEDLGLKGVDSQELRRMLSFAPESGYNLDMGAARKFMKAVEDAGGVDKLDLSKLTKGDRELLNYYLERVPEYARYQDPSFTGSLKKVSTDDAPDVLDLMRTPSTTAVVPAETPSIFKGIRGPKDVPEAPPVVLQNRQAVQGRASNQVQYLNEQSGHYTRYMTESQRSQQAGLLRITDQNSIAAIDFKVPGAESHSKRLFETLGLKADPQEVRRMLSFKPESGYNRDLPAARKFMKAIEDTGGVDKLDLSKLSKGDRELLNYYLERVPEYASYVDPDVKVAIKKVSTDVPEKLDVVVPVTTTPDSSLLKGMRGPATKVDAPASVAEQRISLQSRASNRVQYLNEQSGHYTRAMSQTQREHQAGLLKITDPNRVAAIDFKIPGTESDSRKLFDGIGLKVDPQDVRRMLSFTPQSGYNYDLGAAKKFVKAVEAAGGVDKLDVSKLSTGQKRLLNYYLERVPEYAKYTDPDIKLDIKPISIEVTGE